MHGVRQLLLIAGATALAARVGSGWADPQDVRTGPAKSSLQWTVVEDCSEEERSGLGELLTRTIGAPPGKWSCQRVLLTDSTPFGDPARERRLIRCFVSGVRVERPGSTESRQLELALLFDEGDRRLILAHTTSRDEWVLPQKEEWTRSAEDAISDLATIRSIWPLSADQSLRSTVTEILESLWSWGIDPRAAGQIILRPRMVLSTLPSVESEEREGWHVENPNEAVQWVVDVRGMVTYVTGGDLRRYLSGRVLFLRDDDPTFMQSVYVP